MAVAGNTAGPVWFWIESLPSSRCYETSMGRVAHPFHAEVAVRLIVWFPPGDPGTVVVALFAGDKARMGDVFYDSVGARADAAIGQWLFQQQKEFQ